MCTNKRKDDPERWKVISRGQEMGGKLFLTGMLSKQINMKVTSGQKQLIVKTSHQKVLLIDILMLQMWSSVLIWLRGISSFIHDARVTSQRWQRWLRGVSRPTTETPGIPHPPPSARQGASWVMWLSLACHACAMEQKLNCWCTDAGVKCAELWLNRSPNCKLDKLMQGWHCGLTSFSVGVGTSEVEETESDVEYAPGETMNHTTVLYMQFHPF